MEFEKQTSPDQRLTFDFLQTDAVCNSAFMSYQDAFRSDSGFTNLALLFSDQCPFAIEVCTFKGCDRSEVIQRSAFTGSVLRQLDLCLRHLVRRQDSDHPDYPLEAIRQTLLNCICHRDYSLGGSTQISVFSDRIEFVSLGSIADGLDLAALRLGVAHSRNPVLCSVMYAMNLTDSFGTGIDKIRISYKAQKQQPLFESSAGVFKTTLPNCSWSAEEKKKKAFFISEKDQILSFAREQGFVSRKEVEELLDSGSTKSYGVLKQLCKEGLLKHQGSGRSSIYIP